MTPVPNINLTDGCTAEHYIYPNGLNGVDVEHYKIIGGGHTWPGAPFTVGVTNRDINASIKIWEFFMQYDINGKIGYTALNDLSSNNKLTVYPNPALNSISIKGIDNSGNITAIQITTISGKKVKFLESYNESIDISDLADGIYFFTFLNGNQSQTIRFVKR